MSLRLLLGALPPLLLLLIYSAAIDQPATAINQNSDVFNQAYYYYGTGDGLQTWQHDVLTNLSFPQSYSAIIDRLGYPDARSESGLVDFYQLPAGGFIAIEYATDGSAIGYSSQMGG